MFQSYCVEYFKKNDLGFKIFLRPYDRLLSHARPSNLYKNLASQTVISTICGYLFFLKIKGYFAKKIIQ